LADGFAVWAANIIAAEVPKWADGVEKLPEPWPDER
jgi:hypothetical protein